MNVDLGWDLEGRKQELRAKIAQGLKSIEDGGEGVDGEEFFAQLEREEAGFVNCR